MRTFTDARRRSIALAGIMVVGGLTASSLAWRGVADTLSVAEQVPFALSGGVAGVSLVGTGLALLNIQRRRYEAAEERRDLRAFATALVECAELLAARRTDAMSPQQSRTPGRPQRVLHRALDSERNRRR